MIGLAAGTVVGAIALHHVAGPNVQRVFGCLVLASVLVSVFGVPVAASATNLIIGGAAAGVMGTVVGIHGPPISLVFQSADPRMARSMLGVFFAIAYLGSVLALALSGRFGGPELERTVVLLPGVALGLVVAPLARRFVDRKRLRIAILGIAAVSGITLVFK